MVCARRLLTRSDLVPCPSGAATQLNWGVRQQTLFASTRHTRLASHLVTSPIATRRHQLHTAHGTRDVELRIYRPEPLDAPVGDYRCRVEVTGLSARVDHYAYGGDAMQALLLAITMGATDVECAQLGEGERLTWLGGDDLGIPYLLPAR